MGIRVRSDQVSDLIQVYGSRSKCKGGFPSMLYWPSELNLCREMGTHPGRVILFVETGYPKGP